MRIGTTVVALPAETPSTFLADVERTAEISAAAYERMKAITPPVAKAQGYAALMASADAGLSEVRHLFSFLAAHELTKARQLASAIVTRGLANNHRAEALGLTACAENPVPSS
jgi:hypothetical protein